MDTSKPGSDAAARCLSAQRLLAYHLATVSRCAFGAVPQPSALNDQKGVASP